MFLQVGSLVIGTTSNFCISSFISVVGEVAYTGKHCWVSQDDIFTGKANSKFVSEVSFY